MIMAAQYTLNTSMAYISPPIYTKKLHEVKSQFGQIGRKPSWPLTFLAGVTCQLSFRKPGSCRLPGNSIGRGLNQSETMLAEIRKFDGIDYWVDEVENLLVLDKALN